MSDSAWLDVTLGITQERLDKALEILKTFKEAEFSTKVDWLGVCPFRSCGGSNGRHSALGKPRPKPHADWCPYSKLKEFDL